MYVWRMYTALHIYTHGTFFAGNCGKILDHGLDKLIRPWFSPIHETLSFEPDVHRDETKQMCDQFSSKKGCMRINMHYSAV